MNNTPILIKRYKTRKLYNGGQYITLLDILRYIQLNQPFKIINFDGKDITKQYTYKALSIQE